MILIQDWYHEKRHYECDPRSGVVRDAENASASSQGFGGLVRVGAPFIGKVHFLWACVDAGEIVLGIDNEALRMGESPIHVSLTNAAPFVKRFVIRHGDRIVLSANYFHNGITDPFPEDAHGDFPSFLTHLFSSAEVLREYERTWSPTKA